MTELSLARALVSADLIAAPVGIGLRNPEFFIRKIPRRNSPSHSQTAISFNRTRGRWTSSFRTEVGKSKKSRPCRRAAVKPIRHFQHWSTTICASQLKVGIAGPNGHGHNEIAAVRRHRIGDG